MENKNSVGRFIAALRQAKGLTQRELGDLLFVSNKTVSRWERDECTPDLYLIPAIAEIFGITTDELLRGERKAGDGGNAGRRRRKGAAERA
ncbi:MAG: helix-turn-helix domain-containing protein [Oscillospiraceae bacterium]